MIIGSRVEHPSDVTGNSKERRSSMPGIRNKTTSRVKLGNFDATTVASNSYPKKKKKRGRKKRKR